MKNITILGSTGSIGTQTIQVVKQHPNRFKTKGLSAHSNVDLLAQQAKGLCPEAVCIYDQSKVAYLKQQLKGLPIKVYSGDEGLKEIVRIPSVHLVVSAMVGFAGLLPTIEAIKQKKNIALANKETLVVAGEVMTHLVKEHAVELIPIDSEHSAVLQCLAGEQMGSVKRIILTASGGPFRGMRVEQLEKVSPKEALKHPNWAMGAKITIDSATLMNKGLEVIEAKWLFDISPQKLEVIVHPQSIIHSIVEFEDHSMKAQMGLPDMKVPIQFALSYPDRIKASFASFNFFEYPMLTFENADRNTFPCLQLAFDSMEKGGNMPCILNAANEMAVHAFLEKKIPFLGIAELVKQAMDTVPFEQSMSIDTLIDTDKETRNFARSLF